LEKERQQERKKANDRKVPDDFPFPPHEGGGGGLFFKGRGKKRRGKRRGFSGAEKNFVSLTKGKGEGGPDFPIGREKGEVFLPKDGGPAIERKM